MCVYVNTCLRVSVSTSAYIVIPASICPVFINWWYPLVLKSGRRVDHPKFVLLYEFCEVFWRALVQPKSISLKSTNVIGVCVWEKECMCVWERERKREGKREKETIENW